MLGNILFLCIFLYLVLVVYKLLCRMKKYFSKELLTVLWLVGDLKMYCTVHKLKKATCFGAFIFLLYLWLIMLSVLHLNV